MSKLQFWHFLLSFHFRQKSIFVMVSTQIFAIIFFTLHILYITFIIKDKCSTYFIDKLNEKYLTCCPLHKMSQQPNSVKVPNWCKTIWSRMVLNADIKNVFPWNSTIVCVREREKSNLKPAPLHRANSVVTFVHVIIHTTLIYNF